MSEQNLPEKPIFITTCFSTNYSNYHPMTIMKQYFINTECQDVSFNKDLYVEFTHKLLAENGSTFECKNYYMVISEITKNQKIHEESDCYIIFFDLENTESLIELNKILSLISENGNKNNKIYVINIYSNEKSIKSNLTEENINVNFEKHGINNYDISIVNLDSSDELVRVIDSLTEDTIEDKSIFLNCKELNGDKSNSKCIII